MERTAPDAMTPRIGPERVSSSVYCCKKGLKPLDTFSPLSLLLKLPAKSKVSALSSSCSPILRGMDVESSGWHGRLTKQTSFPQQQHSSVDLPKRDRYSQLSNLVRSSWEAVGRNSSLRFTQKPVRCTRRTCRTTLDLTGTTGMGGI